VLALKSKYDFGSLECESFSEGLNRRAHNNCRQ